MNKYFYLLSILFLQFKLIAQEKIDKSILWEISGNGLPEKSYLFGTVHMIPKADYFLPEGFEKAFEKANTLYLELDMNEMSDPSKLMGIMDKCFMKNDQKLSNLLSKEEFELVSKNLEKSGLPSIIFERMKPLFLSAIISMGEMDPSEDAKENMKSYEMEFMNKANERKMPLKGIETLEFQLSIFDSIPYEVQAKSLVESFKNNSESEVSTQSLITLYKSQDIEKLSESVDHSDQYLLPYMKMMVENRNKAWIPIIQEVMKSGSSFFAVGAGHLGGSNGVITLLRRAGYTLSPIKS